MKELNAKDFGLNGNIILKGDGKSSYIIVMDRKSRIVMKDCEKIRERIEMIRRVDPTARVDIETTAPVCSKTMACLKNEGNHVKSIGY